MSKIIKFLYTILPSNFINFVGKSEGIKGLRDRLLRPKKIDKIISDEIIWGSGKFHFFGPIKMVVKAKKRGIESKLLRNSIKLLKDFKINQPVILDIGANYGFISLALQTNLENNTIIHSFEPHPEIFATFQKSILQNKMSNITAKNVAVGNENTSISLNLYGQTSNILNINNTFRGTTTIQQICLDEYLQENTIIPNFIKIDVDGYELNVLKGLQQTIEKYMPIMVIETNDDNEVLEFLKNCNYKLLDLDLNEFEGIPNNVFCIQ